MTAHSNKSIPDASQEPTHAGANRTPYSEGFAKRMAKMAAKPMIDIQVCDHCNLRCAGCLHFAPLAEPRFLDLDKYEKDLERLSSIEGIDGYFDTVVLMGGEPLLHPRIADVIRLTRRFLPTQNVGLCTNGLKLKRMGEDFWSAIVECDVQIALSPYPIAMDYAALVELARKKGARVTFNGDITDTHEGKEVFMRLALDPEGRCDPTRSFVSCPVGGRTLQLARGAIWPCQVAALHGDFARRFGFDMHSGPDDALPIASIAAVGDIEAFRRRSHGMCRYCDNDALSVMPWELSKLAATEWLSPRALDQGPDTL